MQRRNENRRSFLKQILAGSTVVAATALVGKKARAEEKSKAKRTGDTLYRETEAFTKYYDSLR